MEKQKKLENYGVKFSALTMQTLKMTLPNMDFAVEKVSNHKENLQSIKFNNIVIEVGDSFTKIVKMKTCDDIDLRYKVNKIFQNKGKQKEILLMESYTNKTSIFVLPFVFNSRKDASFVDKGGYFMNAFVDCQFSEKKDGNSIFVLTKFIKTDRYKEVEDYFVNHDQFIKVIDADPNYVIYEFAIKERFSNDLKILLNGKYSKISEAAKKRILSFHEKHMDGLIAHKVIFRDPKLVEKYERDFDVCMTGIEIYPHFDEEDILTKDLL